jgi:signal transduction histidine kinase
MNKLIKRLLNTFFGENLDLGVQVFHLLGFVGIILGIVNALHVLLDAPPSWHLVLNPAASIFAILIIWYAKRTGRYRLCSALTITAVFMVVFPMLYFTGDGYRGTMPMFFLLALVFTVLMLQGWLRHFFLIAELLVYAFCIIAGHYALVKSASITLEFDGVINTMVSFACVGGTLILIITLYVRIYNRQRRKLAEQNAELAESNRSKTEFLQDIGHEIRNPLQVISSGLDFIRSRRDTQNSDEETINALDVIQNETIRLGVMINGMVDTALMSEKIAARTRIDFAAMLRHSAEAARIELEKKRIAFKAEIAPDLPLVNAIPEQFERVPVNLLLNAINATEDGGISLTAVLADNYITVKIRDDGKGIDPAMLPRVFERGVSGGSGKGYGLSICKTIVEAHGGAISIESEQGKGTIVTFSIPVYGGQSEGRV